MIRIKIILLSALVILQLFGCRGHSGNGKDKLVDSTSKEAAKTVVSENSTQVLYDSSFIQKPLVACKLILSPEQKEEDDFLNTNIACFEVQSLPEQHLINEEYCRFVLEKTDFMSIPASDFEFGNVEFSTAYTNIDHYGKCFIGKYYFPSAINAAQRRVVIIVQINRKEVTILNFDDVEFINGKLNCDFNVRGKHSIHKLKYSNECKRFIQFN